MEFAIIFSLIIGNAVLWRCACGNRAISDVYQFIVVLSQSGLPAMQKAMACRQFEKVSYYKHVWALFFFRDPWKLYSKEIQDIMRGKDGL